MGSWSPLGALWPCLGALRVPYDLPGCALGALWVPLVGRQLLRNMERDGPYLVSYVAKLGPYGAI